MQSKNSLKISRLFLITCPIDNNPCDDEAHLLLNCTNKMTLKIFLKDFLNQKVIDKI